MEGEMTGGGGGVANGKYLGVSERRSMNASSQMPNSCTIFSEDARRGGSASGPLASSLSESSSVSESLKASASSSAMSAMKSGIERETAVLRSCSRSRNFTVGRFLAVGPVSPV